MLLTVLVIILLAVSIIALAFGSAEPSRRVQTFSQSSPQERAFEQRGARWRMIGLVSLGLAAIIGSGIVLNLLR